MMTYETRKALLWFRAHGPTPWRPYDPDCPDHRMLDQLVRAGLLCFDPHRKRFDPPSFVLSDIGRKALEP